MGSLSFGQSKDSTRELKRLNAKIDRVRVMVDSLELDNQILLPELMSAFRQAVKSKAQQDSITLVILKRINTLSNKIANLENQSRYMDSTALEIFNKLVLVENKIVTLTNSYNEMAKLKSGSAESNRIKVGKVSWDDVKVIAEQKMPDLNCFTVESAMKMVAGTARSMGIVVDGGNAPA